MLDSDKKILLLRTTSIGSDIRIGHIQRAICCTGYEIIIDILNHYCSLDKLRAYRRLEHELG